MPHYILAVLQAAQPEKERGSRRSGSIRGSMKDTETYLGGEDVVPVLGMYLEV